MSTIIDASVTVQNDTITTSFTVDGDTVTATLSANPRGPRGYTGPNEVTTATLSDLTGAIWADGTNIRVGVEGTDYLTPSGDGSGLTGITSSQITDASGSYPPVASKVVRMDVDRKIYVDEVSCITVNSDAIYSTDWSFSFGSTFTYAPGAASDHRTALGLGELATLTPGTNVATVLGVEVGGVDGILLTNGDGSQLSGLTSSQITDASTGGNDTADAGKLLKFGANGEISSSWFQFPLATNASSKVVTPLVYPPFYGSETSTLDYEAICKFPVLSQTDSTKVLAVTDSLDGRPVSADISDAAEGWASSSEDLKLVRFGVGGGCQFGAVSIYDPGVGSLTTLIPSASVGGVVVTMPSVDGTLALTSNADGVPDKADKLTTARNIFGISFDGTANVSGNATNAGHFASIPTGGEAGHFITLNGTAPTVIAGRSAWFSDGSGVPSFRNGTGSVVTLTYSGGPLGTPSSGTLTSCTGLPVSTGISGLGTGVATALAVNVGSAGAFVTFNGALGTPSSGTLTNCTIPASAITGTTLASNVVTSSLTSVGTLSSLTVTNNIQTNSGNVSASAVGSLGFLGRSRIYSSSDGTIQFRNNANTSDASLTAAGLTLTGTPLGAGSGGTGVNSLGTGVATFLQTPTSANLAAAVSDETGSGSLVFGTSPTLSSPILNSPVFSAQTIADISTLNLPTSRPICVVFDDFLGNVAQGNFPWVDSGTGSTDTGSTGGGGLFLGVCRLNTGAVSTNNRSRGLFIGPTTVSNGAIWRACFAIPTVTDVTVFIGGAGGGGYYGLLYDHGVNSSQWTLSTTGGVVTTFTTEVAQAGNFLSGKRYQMTLQRVSNTSCTLLLEIADWNSTTWTTVFSGTITHTSNSPDWGMCSPNFSVTTKTSAARSLIVDWFSFYHSGISR